jgi:aspartate kinase
VGGVSNCSGLTVIKLGGSVLTDAAAYRRAAAFVGTLAAVAGARVVVVVSAEFGHTDALLSEAQRLVAVPDPDALALLWSTGELRSVALLTLALQSAGVRAAGLNVHEAGLRCVRPARGGRIAVNALGLRAAIARHRVVVVPGFLATSGTRVVTLERGGSDWSAVLLAGALGASRCVLIKDVDGYYTGDPRTESAAQLIPALSYDEALEMADAGCPLVQRQAVAEARARGVELVVRSFDSEGTEMTSEVVLHRT